jgi:hypothetical protein
MGNPVEEAVKLAQRCIEKVPVIVLGSGASRPFGISGMPELQAHLMKQVNPASAGDAQLWAEFTSELARCGDLELTLHNVRLSPSLEAEVVNQTRRLVLRDDLRAFEDLLAGQAEFPVSTLLRHLFRSTHSSVTVVTTNYDRLAEYAADVEGLENTTGFTHGYFRSFGTLTAPNQPSRGSRVVEILKVHGSVDWFQDAHGTALCLPDSAHIPPSFVPLMVTPGTGKYLATHEEPFRTIITRSDAAFANARAVLTVGYGFNDRHIQPKLTNRVLRQQVPLLVLARTLTRSARSFLAQCKHSSFLALEADGANTRAHCLAHPSGLDLPGTNLWEFGKLLADTIGKP